MRPEARGEAPPRGVVLPAEGDLDVDGCHVLRTRIAQALGTGARYVVLDLADVTSFGTEATDLLRGLRRYLRRWQGDVVVVRPSPAVRSSLRVNGLDDLLTIDDGTPARALRVVADADAARS